MRHVEVSVQSIDRFVPLVGEGSVSMLRGLAARLARTLDGRAVWNVNSTERGGGVAELLRPLIGYSRGLGVDARWVVIEGSPEFFIFTKRLHNALHGSAGDGSLLNDSRRPLYERTLNQNLGDLATQVQPGDIVVLHDPQTAGLAPGLLELEAQVVWRCHVGTEERSDEGDLAWGFLAPYLSSVERFVFSRASYVPPFVDPRRTEIITPSIDPLSSKNVELAPDNVRAILVHAGLVGGPGGAGPPTFVRDDGSPARVDRAADILRLGRAPRPETPLVTQISRWDRLKDPVGVLLGFAKLLNPVAPRNAELVLAGPNVHAVADDPEGAEVFADLVEHWRALPRHQRTKIHLANLPMADVEENAAIVNALQRHSAVIVQKSLREGFGLTVAEAMWKSRPVIASAVGGIQDQIVDGESGLLLRDPTDLSEFSVLMQGVLHDEAYARRLGAAARERVKERFLGIQSLLGYERLVSSLVKTPLFPSAEDQPSP